MGRFLFVLSCVVASAQALAAASSPAAEFLTLPYNPREMAIGPVAHLEGVDGVFHNAASSVDPAGKRKPGWEVAAAANRVAESVNYANLAFLKRNERAYGSFGVGLVYLGIQDIAITDETGTNQGTGTAFDLAGIINYSRELPWKLQLGGNAKVIYQKLYDADASSVAFDVGMKRYFLPKNGPLVFAFSVNHIGPNMQFIQQQDLSSSLGDGQDSSSFNQEGSPMPMTAVASVSYTPRFILPRWLSVAVSPYGQQLLDEATIYGVGVEAVFAFGASGLFVGSRAAFGDTESTWAGGGGLFYTLTNSRLTLAAGFIPGSVLGDELMISGKFTQLMSAK